MSAHNDQFTINQPIFCAFVVYDSQNNPVTGLVKANFNFLFSNNGSIVNPVVTFGETGNGRYFFSFTPNALGEWAGLVTNAIYNPRGWFQEFYVVQSLHRGSSGDSAGAVWWHTNEFQEYAAYKFLVEEEEKKKMLLIVSMIDD